MISMVLGVFGIIVSLILIGSCFFIVQPKQARFVFTWVGGAVHHTVINPGLKIKMPWPFQTVSSQFSLAEMMISATNRCRSKDEAFFDLEVTAIVKREARMMEEAIFNMERPLEQIKISVSEAVKRVIPTLKLNEVYEDREAVKAEVINTLNSIYKKHGYECLEVIVEDPKLEKTMEQASNQRIENKRRAEAAEDLAVAIFKEETAEAEAAAESLRLRSAAAGQSKGLYTKEVIKSIQEFREAFPDLDPQILMNSMEGLDRRDSIISASKNPGSVIVIDSNSDASKQYSSMAAYASSGVSDSKANHEKGLTARSSVES